MGTRFYLICHRIEAKPSSGGHYSLKGTLSIFVILSNEDTILFWDEGTLVIIDNELHSKTTEI